MEKASEAILGLKPVTFRYKHDLDPEGVPQFGLVAEEVEKVNPDLVARDEQGKPFTVRYEAVNTMLLNEFLKEHKKVEDLDATVASLVQL
jgi:trimeric autotransporter adhesin